jgi:hypothetical protein
MITASEQGATLIRARRPGQEVFPFVRKPSYSYIIKLTVRHPARAYHRRYHQGRCGRLPRRHPLRRR